MPFDFSITQSLLTQPWYFPLLILTALAVYYFGKSPQKLVSSPARAKSNDIGPWLAALVTFAVLSAPYWIFGSDAPHSTSDDATCTLQTYLSASHQGDSINWTNSLMGGMDRWLLPNCHPLALGRIYALFLKPYQLYLLVIGINVIAVFIFSWKIQIEFWGMRRWMAYIGSAVAAITEGYWTGEAHVTAGHGFAIIIVAIYWLTRFHQSSKFWMVSLLVGLALALGAWAPFYTLPPLFVTITLWGLVFWGRGAWIKVLQANILIILPVLFILLPQLLAMKLLYAASARSEVLRITVDLKKIFSLSGIVMLGILGILGAILKIYKQKIVKQVLMMLLGFCAVPLMANILQILKIIPAFRWELFYKGNDAWFWLGIIFFTDKIQQAIAGRWRLGGIVSRLMVFSVWWTVIAFGWMDSLWHDLDTSYPSGNWGALTDTSISAVIKKMDPGPMRVVGIDDTNDMHFWGQYQGLESMIGYTPLIDKRKTYFWWYAAMVHGQYAFYAPGFLSIAVPVADHSQHLTFPIPLPALVNIDALKLANVHWIISRHPLYPVSGLEALIQQPGEPMACTDRGQVPSNIDFKTMRDYWGQISCYVKDFRYQRSLYVYYLKGALPRAYLAAHVSSWPADQSFLALSRQELALAAQGTAYVDFPHWIMYQDQTSSGKVAIEDYQSDYMHLRISTDKDAIVVIASTLNPYWRLLVDKHPVRFFDVNGFQTGFEVHPENTEAELIYCPPWRLQEHPYCREKQAK